jgi:DNA polymerase-3 subunit beta
MKVEIERAASQALLARLKAVTPQRSPIPMLTHLRISAGDGVVQFTATDLDLILVGVLQAKIEVAGDATAPAQELHDIARQLSTKTMRLETEDRSIVIRGGRARLRLDGLPPEDFPDFKADNLPWYFEIEGAEVDRLISDVAFAAATEERRFYLNGVHLHVAGDALRVVSCDGNRLAKSETSLPKGTAGMPGVIVPNKTVALLQALVKGFSGEVGVALSDVKIQFRVGNSVLISKLIDGAFPEYERVIPTGNDRIVDVDARALIEAVELVQIVTSKKSRIVILDVGVDSLAVSAFVEAGGAAGDQEIDASVDGAPTRIAFNAEYLLDAARHVGNIVRLRLSGNPSDPGIV